MILRTASSIRPAPFVAAGSSCRSPNQRNISAAFDASDTPLKIRVGVNAGEPIEEDDDLYGTAVIQAARAMNEAAGGEILCTNVVRELAKGRPYLFTDRGAVSLRGFDEPVHLYEVSWRQEA